MKVAKHVAGVGTPGGYKRLDSPAKTVQEKLRATTNSSRPFTALYNSKQQSTPKPLTLLKKLVNFFKSEDARAKTSSPSPAAQSLLKQLDADILNPQTKRTLNDAKTAVEQANKFVALPTPETARVMGFESPGTAKEKLSTGLDCVIEKLTELLETSNDRLAIQLTMSHAMKARASLQKVDLDAIPDITDISPPSVI